MMGSMPRKPVARDAVLDAYERLLIDVGERAATLDAVAKEAGVSKGGLLYHFPNKEALISALLERFVAHAEDDLAMMKAAPEGAAEYFISTSIFADTPMDRAFVAANRLAEVAHAEARQRFTAIQGRWLELIANDVGAAAAKAVLYMGDGMYFNAVWESRAGIVSPNREADVESLIQAVRKLRN